MLGNPVPGIWRIHNPLTVLGTGTRTAGPVCISRTYSTLSYKRMIFGTCNNTGHIPGLGTHISAFISDLVDNKGITGSNNLGKGKSLIPIGDHEGEIRTCHATHGSECITLNQEQAIGIVLYNCIGFTTGNNTFQGESSFKPCPFVDDLPHIVVRQIHIGSGTIVNFQVVVIPHIAIF